MDDKQRVKRIIVLLSKAHPDAKCALDFKDPLELLVATILSAQCTDARVNIVTKDLFRKHRTAADYAKAPLAELEQDIKTCGFFRAKAKSISGACRVLVEKHGGQVPTTMEEMVELPGVGRKTANVVLGVAFGQPAITVDTHVRRLALRLGLTRNTDPDKIELDLQAVTPTKDWTQFSHLLIFHGRRICHARKPDHAECVIRDLCPSRDI